MTVFELNICCNVIKFKWNICANTTDVVKNFTVIKSVSIKRDDCNIFDKIKIYHLTTLKFDKEGKISFSLNGVYKRNLSENEISNNLVCSSHRRSLIRAFASRLNFL